MRVLAGPLVLLCAACAVHGSAPASPPSSPEDPASAPPATPAPTAPARARPEPPRDVDVVPTLAVDVEGPPKVLAGQTITLLVRVRSRLVPPRPLHLSITVPRGVRLVEGMTEEVLAGPGPLFERRLKLAVDAIPADDLVADATLAEGTSLHVTCAYRFGRAAAPLPSPPPDDPDTTIRKPHLDRQTVPPGPSDSSGLLTPPTLP